MGLKKNKESFPGNRYSVIGVDDPDRIQGELASVCRSSFNIQVRPKISVESLDCKILITAFIPESFCREKPVFIKKYGEEKGTYRRIGSSDQRCTAEDLDLLYQLRRQKAYEADVFPEADMRALVLAREVGAITNQDYILHPLESWGFELRQSA